MIFKINPCKCELLQPKIEESTTYGDFDPHAPTPTWHQILIPIGMFVTVLITYLCRYIHNLYAHKVWRKLKDTFDYLPTRSYPSHPIKLALRARPAFSLNRKAFGAGPRRDIVGA